MLNSREEILPKLTEILVEMFEVDEADITEEAHLSDDLDIDSIDAVDLIVRLKEVTGKKIAPEEFKSVRTVGDVVGAIEKVMAEK
ncbi:acyl carrier protein [Microbulbifer sp. JMSA004]|uniref:acyl carrier protein n=1 Tax=unclassified Microbulbifer TaxID=2619833 RepID=UPI00192E0211|nr:MULTISPECIES: acyl carrier protein [unclassified Microbulbifer]WHI44765.1 acyl carrier protein [Microbulbifer sp. VAAF005]WNZ56476.1 acyl carrier protein [Microbulbifer sp. MKSA007]